MSLAILPQPRFFFSQLSFVQQPSLGNDCEFVQFAACVAADRKLSSIFNRRRQDGLSVVGVSPKNAEPK